MKKVSAVIITHNRLELLKRAIKSVMSQTYSNIECVVVDDASTDGTKIYCENLPIEYIHISQEESRGGNHARNVGIMASHGDYIAFLDDDDYWLPEKIEKQVALIESKSDCSLVYCASKFEIVSRCNKKYRDVYPSPRFSGDMSRRILMLINCCTSSLILVERSLLLKVGMFDENLRFWQDYEFTVRAAQITKFYFVNEPLCVYRRDENDEHRLTNNLNGWENNLAYIYNKHKDLYDRLNFLENTWRKRIWLRDSCRRYKKACQKGKYVCARMKFLLVSILFMPSKLHVSMFDSFYTSDLLDCMRRHR